MGQIGTVAASNGNYPSDDGFTLPKGKRTVGVDGEFGGASVLLKLRMSGSTTYRTIHTFTKAAPEPKLIDYTGGDLLFVVTSAGGSTALTFFIE